MPSHSSLVAMTSLGFALSALLGASFTQDARTPAPWQQAGTCGVNAVFFLLKCSGADGCTHEYRDVMNYVNFSADEGTSINELQDACQQFGLPCQKLRTTPRTAIQRFSPPYIAHWDDTQYGGKGHFVVVLSADEKSVHVVDCGPCVIASIPLEQFTNLSSGYFIVPLSSLRQPSIFKWCLFGSGLGSALFLIFYLRQK